MDKTEEAQDISQRKEDEKKKASREKEDLTEKLTPTGKQLIVMRGKDCSLSFIRNSMR